MRKTFGSLLAWGIIIFGVYFVASCINNTQGVKNISYSEFKRALKENKINRVIVKSNIIKGDMYDGVNVESFRTMAMNDPNLLEDLDKYNVKEYRAEMDNNWLGNLFWGFGPILLLAFFWLFMLKQVNSQGKGAMSFALSSAKQQKNKNITFNDVAGCEESKEELKEIIDFLKSPEKFQKLGGKIPKGVLLYGAPGTGKTLLAKAVAGEAKVPFFSSSGSEFVEMFVGVGASRVRDLFNKGRQNAPCLLFIDEIDAVGRHRFAGIGGGHDEREQTLNQLLVEMDGFDTNKGVILIAATNRPDVLDPALLRPGRFDRQISVAAPDLKGREDILKVHTKNIKLNSEVDLSIIARRTPGFVGADLANVCNEAALLAARRNKEDITMKEMEDAIERVVAGPEKKTKVMSEKERNIIAYHEAGHAVVAKLLDGSDPVHKVSIIPRGRALGYTLQLPLEDKYLTTKTELFNRLIVLLGGRASEEIFCSDITTGAQNDLERATMIASKIVCEFGMTEKIGNVVYRKDESEVFLGRDLSRDRSYSNETLKTIDEEIRDILNKTFLKSKNILESNKEKVKTLVNLLLEKEVVNSEEFLAIFNQ